MNIAHRPDTPPAVLITQYAMIVIAPALTTLGFAAPQLLFLQTRFILLHWEEKKAGMRS